jgi:hypothetical protein
MRVIIAGGRNYRLTQVDYAVLDELKDELPITEVVTGGSAGADMDAEMWARERKLPVRVFHARWKELGRAAGPHRNSLMVEYVATQLPAALLAFPGGDGTADVIGKARAFGLRVLHCGDTRHLA